MSVQARLEAAMNESDYEPDVNGDKTERVDIPSTNLELEKVKDHDLVKDAFEKDDRRYTVYVRAAVPSW